MAISKILHMKDSGNSFHARHLKRALDYVMNPEKTQGGRLVGAINCQADMAFEQMMEEAVWKNRQATGVSHHSFFQRG